MSAIPDPDALTDAQWARLAALMPGGCKGERGPRTNNRLFLDALLWMTRAGGRWRDLPERLGDHQAVILLLWARCRCEGASFQDIIRGRPRKYGSSAKVYRLRHEAAAQIAAGLNVAIVRASAV